MEETPDNAPFNAQKTFRTSPLIVDAVGLSLETGVGKTEVRACSTEHEQKSI